MSRAIADLEGASSIAMHHVAEAINYRALERKLFGWKETNGRRRSGHMEKQFTFADKDQLLREANCSYACTTTRALSMSGQETPKEATLVTCSSETARGFGNTLMRWKPFSSWVVLQCLLALPVYAQTAPTISLPLGESQTLPSPPRTFSLDRNEWPANLSWQKPPAGIGEILVFPNPQGAEEFTWGKHRLIGTELGLLSSDAKDQWQIVPGLYGHPVRVVSEQGELLWAEQVGQGLVALNRDLEVVRRLPAVQGRCVAVESGGFWCLDRFSDGRGGTTAHALVEYGADGTEKRRFVVQELGLVPASKPAATEKRAGFGFSSGGGGIAWAGVDAQFVWVSLNDYHFGGFGGGDAPLTAGEEKLGRLDRASGKFTTFEWPGKHRAGQFLLLPGQLQWISRAAWDEHEVYQLSKETLHISRAMKLVAPGFDFLTRGKNLWLRSRAPDPYERKTRIYSRETFESVPKEEAGAAPEPSLTRPDFLARNVPLWSGILATDEEGLWLSAPRRLLRTGDDGSLLAHDVRPLWEPLSQPGRFAPSTPAGELLWFSNDYLTRVQPKGKVTRLLLNSKRAEKIPEEPLSLRFLAATKERVWYSLDNGQLVTLLPDLSQPREIALSPLLGAASPFWRVDAEKGSVAAGNRLYLWADSGDLLRVDGTTGEVSTVESWKRDVAAGESPNSPRRAVDNRNQNAFTLPDGRIAFTFSSKEKYSGGPVSFYEGQLDKARVFIFDPIKDLWQERDASPKVQPIPVGEKLYGCDARQMFEWRGNGWTAIGKRPLARPPVVFGQEQLQSPDAKIAGTRKYFYQKTALGLYRVPWSQLGSK